MFDNSWKKVIGVLTPGTHGSTYGGNPLACKVAMTALNVLRDEKMFENSAKMGEKLLDGLKQLDSQFIQEVCFSSKKCSSFVFFLLLGERKRSILCN